MKKNDVMTYSEAKTLLLTITETLGFDMHDAKDVFSEIIDENGDFEIANYRFIHSDEIDGIQREELESNEYLLGCFACEFISELTGLNFEIVQALQDAEKFEVIGRYIIDNDFLSDLQSEYARVDGYGHHFAHYDSREHEINTCSGLYYAFRIN